MDEFWRPAHNRRICGGCGSAGNTSAANDEYSVSCTTFNILAPIYKRLDNEVPSLFFPFLHRFSLNPAASEVDLCELLPLAQDQSRRESQHRAYWLSRNTRILDRLVGEKSSIICLQEVWVGNEELVGLYEKTLHDAGYVCFKLARTNNRGDGLLTALRRDHFRVLNYRELLFNDFGDRVAQLLHVQNGHGNIQQDVLIVNTHLLFPHDYRLCVVRLHQVYKILQYVEAYQKEHELNPMPIILCGDWNGSKKGRVYKFLRSQGFVSSYDTAHRYTDSDADAHKWVSHRNHRGNICGVDFIWLLNPSKSRRPLKISWNNAVFGIIKYFLRQASMSEDDSFLFLKAGSDGDCITYSSFCQALCRLHLSGHPCGLSSEEIRELWAHADADGDGVVDRAEFQRRIWGQGAAEPPDAAAADQRSGGAESLSIGFNVKNAALFPPEAEKGMWPENYSLSDHAPLTVVFSPVREASSQPIC